MLLRACNDHYNAQSTWHKVLADLHPTQTPLSNWCYQHTGNQPGTCFCFSTRQLPWMVKLQLVCYDRLFLCWKLFNFVNKLNFLFKRLRLSCLPFLHCLRLASVQMKTNSLAFPFQEIKTNSFAFPFQENLKALYPTFRGKCWTLAWRTHSY